MVGVQVRIGVRKPDCANCSAENRGQAAGLAAARADALDSTAAVAYCGATGHEIAWSAHGLRFYAVERPGDSSDSVGADGEELLVGGMIFVTRTGSQRDSISQSPRVVQNPAVRGRCLLFHAMCADAYCLCGYRHVAKHGVKCDFMPRPACRAWSGRCATNSGNSVSHRHVGTGGRERPG